ncbi:unnamed protein product [Porites evermanni]|uniref:Transcription and mRNA export factor ENY2 n=1 Tax=Porites evermanni TaxID=104178 RepID=A0ABN8M0V3_9CNID|nr:unnamed protein product [Porites evermanni]
MDVNEGTPREIIRGVLTTTSVSKSARSVRPRTTPRAFKVRETPVNPPSQAEVASRMLTRSRSANKRKAPLAIATTPSDSTTPRTLISGFLQIAPVAKSAVKLKKPKTVPAEKSEAKRGTTRASLHDDNTPRSTIQNVLREAIAETPVEPTFSPSTETEDDMTPQQANDSKNQSSHMISTAPNENKPDTAKKSDERTTTGQSDEINIEVASRSQDSLEEREDTMPNVNDISGLNSTSSIMVTADQALQTDTVISDDAVQHKSGKWQDLVTPKLPLNILAAGGRQSSASKNDEVKRAAGAKKFFGGKPPTGKVNAVKSSKYNGLEKTLPASVFLINSGFHLKLLSSQLAIPKGSQLFFKQISSDLMAYCQHAHRTTIELSDVELLMKRQGFITENQSLYSLVEKRIKDSQLSASINQKLVESGERERLKELLRTKLIECGWRDKLRSHCKEVIKQKGLENVTVDDLVAEITPTGRGEVWVPTTLR